MLITVACALLRTAVNLRELLRLRRFGAAPRRILCCQDVGGLPRIAASNSGGGMPGCGYAVCTGATCSQERHPMVKTSVASGRFHRDFTFSEFHKQELKMKKNAMMDKL